MFKRKSFFERLTGGIRLDDSESPDQEEKVVPPPRPMTKVSVQSKDKETESASGWAEESEEEAQLTVDVYQTPTEIIVEAMIAGVRPDDLSVNITRDMITIRGKREGNKMISDENYFTKELYWGGFSRTILLPQEVEPEEAEAVERHGLLMIKLPKIDKMRKTSLKVKSI